MKVKINVLPFKTNKFLRNKRALITAGPTREYWDPVRYLTNGSSGRMGMALAQEALRLGAQVTLIPGPGGPPPPGPAPRRGGPLGSASESYAAGKKRIHRTDTFVGS